jgi:hypothetical protein
MLEYHRHLQAIADADIAYVRRKDAQYRASWKRRGGPGAFFTIVRPWDRFESMTRDNGYDLFELIEREGLEGPDGSLIACVRDMRRYLLLLEAEMTERLGPPASKRGKIEWSTERVVSLNGQDFVDIERRVMANQTSPRRDLHTERAQREGVSREVAKAKSFSEMYGPGTPEDGGHHERDNVAPYRPPWVMPRETVLAHHLDEWYSEVAPDVFALCANVDTGMLLPPDTLRRYYISSSMLQFAWLDLSQVPPDERVRWPRLPVELNNKEHEETGEFRELYKWDNDQGKWIMRPTFRHADWGLL